MDFDATVVRVRAMSNSIQRRIFGQRLFFRKQKFSMDFLLSLISLFVLGRN